MRVPFPRRSAAFVVPFSICLALSICLARGQNMEKADDDSVNEELSGKTVDGADDATKGFVGTKQTPERRTEALAPIEDVPGLPRVLLIGDSISIGYTLATREELKGKANVHRAPRNCGGTRFARTQLDKWLGDQPWDVIHYNTGLHDMRVIEKTGQPLPPEQFEKNLRTLIERLQAKGTKIIWATTTPLAPNTSAERQAQLKVVNEIGLKVAREKALPVDDLYTVAMERRAEIQLPDDAHFSVEGYAVLAKAVAASIEKELPAKQP